MDAILTFIVRSAGGGTILLSLGALAGWSTSTVAVSENPSGHLPMASVSAFLFLLCGVGLLSRERGWPRLALVSSGLVVMLCCLLLVQSELHGAGGMNHLRQAQGLRESAFSFDSLEPNVMVSFLLTALALLLNHKGTRQRWFPPLVGLLGSAVMALGILALWGYWSETASALDGALGFLLLGIGIGALAWRDETRARGEIPSWLTDLISVAVLSVTLLLWQELRAQEQEAIAYSVNRQAEEIVGELTDRVKTRIGTLMSMKKWWEQKEVFAQAEWESYVSVNLQYSSGFQAIAWVDRSLQVIGVVPLQNNEALLGLDIGRLNQLVPALHLAHEQHDVAFSRSIELAQGGKSFVVFVPLFSGETFVGILGGVFHYQALFDELLQHTASSFTIRMFEGSEEIYHRASMEEESSGPWRQERLLQLPGVSWRVQVAPTSALLASMQSSLPGMTFITGLITTLLLSLVGASLQRVKQHARASETINHELAREIDERLKTEAELREVRDQLELRVQHRTEELTALYDELRLTQQAVLQQERLRALGQMASGIAHDINNAISPSLLYVESLMLSEPGLSAEAQEYLAIVRRTLGDVAQTIARLREFYRNPEANVERLPINLNEVVQTAVELTRARWRDLSQQHGISIAVQPLLEEQLPAVMGTESELREALINLIFNAIDAMPNGGRLSIRTQATPTSVIVKIIDTGIGMDEKTRQRCLEPFYTTKGERGTGLGLAMVYGTLQRHAARIDIASEIGYGTTIRLTFLLPHPTSECTLPQDLGVVVTLPPLKILVVDDDPLLRQSLRDILRVDGHEVVVADGGEAGSDAFRTALDERAFHVVITDLGMPKIDGRELARRVKAQSPTTPVVLLTGWGRQMASEGEFPSYVDYLLSKPPTIEALRKTLMVVSVHDEKERIPNGVA